MQGDDRDDFEGIDIRGPWGGVRIGSGRSRGGPDDDGDRELRAIRRGVRRRLDFFRHCVTYAVVVGALALVDWLTGGGWWVQWVAAIWGALLLMQGFRTFVAPSLWGRGLEDSLVRREVERQRGRVHVTRPPDEGEPR